MKKWYERAEYKNQKLETPEDNWQRVWDKFQETIDRKGWDNSTGDYNYLIGRYIYENGGYDQQEFINKIKQYLTEHDEEFLD